MPLLRRIARDGEGVGDRLVDVDGGDDVAALVRVGHERRGVGRRLGPAVDRVGRPIAAAGRPREAALLVDPLDLLVGEEDRGQRRGVVGLVLAAVLERDAEVEGRGHPAVRRRDPLDAVDGRGRGGGQPEPAVGRQALLRGEVVDVDLARLEAQAAGRRRGVDDHEAVGAGGSLERHGHAGGRLVVGEAVGVDVGVGDRERVGARVGEEVGRLVEVRRGRGDLGELGRELPEAEVLAAAVDEPEGGGVPERRGAAVAEQHLVAVGEREQLGQPVAERAHLELHPGLPVGGAEVVAAGRGQRLDGLGADLGRAAAEAPVGGQQVDRDLDVGERGGHLAMMADRAGASDRDRRRTEAPGRAACVPRWPAPSRHPRSPSCPPPAPSLASASASAAIAESATLAVDAKAKALKAAGEPVIGFGAGEPDFPTPAHIVEAAVEAARDPKNHKYTPAGGLPELKEAIAVKTLRDSGLDVQAEPGARHQRRQARRLQHLRHAPRPRRRGAPPRAVLDHLPRADRALRRRAGRAAHRRDHRLPGHGRPARRRASPIAPRRCCSCRRATPPARCTRWRRSRRSAAGRSSAASG